jgi:hypothetical protein
MRGAPAAGPLVVGVDQRVQHVVPGGERADLVRRRNSRITGSPRNTSAQQVAVGGAGGVSALYSVNFSPPRS